MKILILGVNGMIGHRLLLEFQSCGEFDVFGLMRRSKAEFVEYAFLQEENVIDLIDIHKWENIQKVLNEIEPDVIINAIGITIRRNEITDLNYALDINSFFPQKLAKWVQSNNSKLIHLSTDCVFAGDSGNYSELSIPTALDNYGRTKFLGEVDGPNCLTLRFSCIGQELDIRSELLEWFLAQKDKIIKGYTNALYSGVTNIVIAREVYRIVRNYKELNGVFQISSSPISKYDLLVLAKQFFKTGTIIEPFHDYKSNKILLNDKFVKATGFSPMSWNQMMLELVNDSKIKYLRN